MPFKVCNAKSAALLDSLPVAVISDYPLERRDYKPYAQCNLCLHLGVSLLLRMWAFEVTPEPASSLRCVLYIFPERPDTAISVDLRADGGVTFSLLEDGGEISRELSPPEPLQLSAHNGEDLQGVYWGGLLELPITWLEEHGGALDVTEGAVFRGNFYKLSDGPRFAHKGSYFPADFGGDRPYAPSCMGEFEVVSY